MSDVEGFSRTTACRQTGGVWLKPTNLQFSRCYVSEIKSSLLYLTTTHRSGFLPTPIRITLNDPKCPIQIDVCVLLLSELTMRD